MFVLRVEFLNIFRILNIIMLFFHMKIQKCIESMFYLKTTIKFRIILNLKK